MIPPTRIFEKVAVDEWLSGEITEIQYDMKHLFKASEGPAVKIKIAIVGYKFPKTTPWMLFSYSKKSNLFILFVEPLVEGALEYMSFDLDQLKAAKIKVMFEQKGEYQNILRIRPLENKIKPDPAFMNQEKESQIADVAEVENDDQVPF